FNAPLTCGCCDETKDKISEARWETSSACCRVHVYRSSNKEVGADGGASDPSTFHWRLPAYLTLQSIREAEGVVEISWNKTFCDFSAKIIRPRSTLSKPAYFRVQ
ncbi:unnamed protein product, partial [Ectocarpus sp. 8 AP-2014]